MHAPAVWDPILTRNVNTEKDYLVRDSPFRLLPGDDLLSQELALQVSSALKVLTSVFVYTKSGRAFRHTATLNAYSCSVDRTGGTPCPILQYN